MADNAAASKAETTRNERRTVIGVVTSDKMQKSCRVEVPRQVPHPRYGKIIRRRTVLIAHDEKNDAKIGDTVECMETRPISKTKSWRLVRVVKRAAGSTLGGVASS